MLTQITRHSQTQKMSQLRQLLIDLLFSQLLLYQLFPRRLYIHNTKIDDIHELTLIENRLRHNRIIKILKKLNSLIIPLIKILLKLQQIVLHPYIQLPLPLNNLHILQSLLQIRIILFPRRTVQHLLP